MLRYVPVCRLCRTNDLDNFYKACAGCQERRAKAMTVYHAKPGVPLPPPSINKPIGDS